MLPGSLHPVSLRVRLLLHDDGHRGGQVPGHLHAAPHPGRVQGRILEAGSHLEPLPPALSALGRVPHCQANIHMHHSPPMPGAGSQYRIICLFQYLARAVNHQSGVGVAGDVPGPVPGAAGRHHGRLHPDLLPPVGRGPHRGRHPAAAAPETGQQEEDNQDARPCRHPLRSLLASPKFVSSYIRLESV